MTKQWNDWYDGLAARGKVEHGRPLGLEGRVVSGVRGQRVVDGPFPEGKEVVGGYFFLTVANLEEATAIAQQCPGLPLGLTVEVRPVVAVSPILKGVHGRPPQSRRQNRKKPESASKSRPVGRGPVRRRRAA